LPSLIKSNESILSHQNIELSINGKAYQAKEVALNESVTRGMFKGFSPLTLAFTDPTVDYDGHVTLAFDDYNSLLQDIAASSTTGASGNAFFDIGIYITNTAQSEVHFIALLDCVMNAAPMTSTQGTDPLEVQVAFQCRQVEVNGIAKLVKESY